MNIGDTSHGNKWQVVQEPTKDRIERRIVDLINISLLEVVIASLPSDEVPSYHNCYYAQGGRGKPVDQRVSKEEILDNRVVPSTHTETDMEDWPLPELRGQIVLLVWIWDKCVIRGHHSHVQVDEILEEGGLVGSSIGSRYYDLLANRTDIFSGNLRFSFQ
jgi:hypothetical protein